MDFSYLISISDGDAVFIKEFISTFESNSANILNALKEASRSRNLDAQKKLAHQLKPSLEMLALPSLQIAKEIQADPESVPFERILEIENECNEAVIAMNREFIH